jgi:hypothetical protein
MPASETDGLIRKGNHVVLSLATFRVFINRVTVALEPQRAGYRDRVFHPDMSISISAE